MPTLILAALGIHPAALVPVLGSEDFAARVAAYRALERWGDAALRPLRAREDDADPEVRRAVAELLCACRQRALERIGPFPCVDALWYDTRHKWDDGAGGVSYGTYDSNLPTYEWAGPYLNARGRDGYPFAQYSLATIDLVNDLLDAGVPECVLRAMVAEMRRRDGVYLARNHAGRDWRAEVFRRP